MKDFSFLIQEDGKKVTGYKTLNVGKGERDGHTKNFTAL